MTPFVDRQNNNNASCTRPCNYYYYYVRVIGYGVESVDGIHGLYLRGHLTSPSRHRHRLLLSVCRKTRTVASRPAAEMAKFNRRLLAVQVKSARPLVRSTASRPGSFTQSVCSTDRNRKRITFCRSRCSRNDPHIFHIYLFVVFISRPDRRGVYNGYYYRDLGSEVIALNVLMALVLVKNTRNSVKKLQ